ncbi:unnamed protein product [Allacma fusca]|uniref:Uncharacterized protein n=1 Tax=Allacma fusca TaxID=39272 RepID=A0A8J2NTP8_9HEXA|nr:unnamed protein product [Allacma fusca]
MKKNQRYQPPLRPYEGEEMKKPPFSSKNTTYEFVGDGKIFRGTSPPFGGGARKCSRLPHVNWWKRDGARAKTPKNGLFFWQSLLIADGRVAIARGLKTLFFGFFSAPLRSADLGPQQYEYSSRERESEDEPFCHVSSWSERAARGIDSPSRQPRSTAMPWAVQPFVRISRSMPECLVLSPTIRPLSRVRRVVSSRTSGGR